MTFYRSELIPYQMQRPATRGSFMTQLYSSFNHSYVDTMERTSRPYS